MIQNYSIMSADRRGNCGKW